MWMPPPVPAAPAQWQLVPVETAKPKEPEKATTRCPSNITPQFLFFTSDESFFLLQGQKIPMIT
jgi:hypothetical protein